MPIYHFKWNDPQTSLEQLSVSVGMSQCVTVEDKLFIFGKFICIIMVIYHLAHTIITLFIVGSSFDFILL